jgi:hypothetical protein
MAMAVKMLHVYLQGQYGSAAAEMGTSTANRRVQSANNGGGKSGPLRTRLFELRVVRTLGVANGI